MSFFLLCVCVLYAYLVPLT